MAAVKLTFFLAVDLGRLSKFRSPRSRAIFGALVSPPQTLHPRGVLPFLRAFTGPHRPPLKSESAKTLQRNSLFCKKVAVAAAKLTFVFEAFAPRIDQIDPKSTPNRSKTIQNRPQDRTAVVVRHRCRRSLRTSHCFGSDYISTHFAYRPLHSLLWRQY